MSENLPKQNLCRSYLCFSKIEIGFSSSDYSNISVLRSWKSVRQRLEVPCAGVALEHNYVTTKVHKYSHRLLKNSSTTFQLSVKLLL